jgi:hypothetical protein
VLVGTHQGDLRARHLQYPRTERVAFIGVRVQQPVRRPAVHGGSQLPAEVGRVADAEVESLTAERRVHVCRVPGEQHPADAVLGGLAGVVGEPGRAVRIGDRYVHFGYPPQAAL